ncbi:MAG: hypothetical protein RLZZ196_3341 [Bacteroidota bacterium]|jgi:cell wall-associated NlpC family hydrolase
MKKLIILIVLFISSSTISFAQYCENESVNRFIVEWIGKPYKLGGFSSSGIDCSGLVKKFYKDICEIDIPRVCYQQWNATTRILKSDLVIGDIVFFNSPVSPSGWHCGIYIGGNKFLHASNRIEGVKISSLDDDLYKKRYKGAGHF